MEKRENEMRKQKGFSLIELLIVVAIILIIAAIAIPNLLRARIAANESSAVSSVRTINTAEVTYQSGYPTFGYADTLAKLGPGGVGVTCPATGPTQANSCLIDSVLANAIVGGPAKSGYVFALGATQGTGGLFLTYTVGTAPVAFNQTGVRDFCSNEDAVVQFAPGASGAAPVGQGACVSPGFSPLQ
jgi:prepilin-type N-terminal cleavage/methylation domain-containing protein